MGAGSGLFIDVVPLFIPEEVTAVIGTSRIAMNMFTSAAVSLAKARTTNSNHQATYRLGGVGFATSVLATQFGFDASWWERHLEQMIDGRWEQFASIGTPEAATS